MGRCAAAELAATGCQCRFATSSTVDLSGTGEEGSPHTATVRVSATAGNSLSATGDGLLVARLPSRGVVTVATDELGFATFAHGLPFTPAVMQCQGRSPMSGTSDLPFQVETGTPNAANVTVRIQDNSGPLANVSGIVLTWIAVE